MRAAVTTTALLWPLGGIGAVLVATAACDGGCGRRADRGASGAEATPLAAPARHLDLSGTDCSDGLARCVAGRIEVSRAAHIPHPCGGPAVAPSGSPERPGGACACPWEPAGTCPGGCAEDGLEVFADAAVARTQLCRFTGRVARPPLPGEREAGGVCAEEAVRCRDGLVRRCAGVGLPERIDGACLEGCEPGIALDHGEPMAPDGASMILCRRPTAERQ